MPRQNWPITASCNGNGAHRDRARSIMEAIHAQATALMPTIGGPKSDPIHAMN